jgi:hypothetical protein
MKFDFGGNITGNTCGSVHEKKYEKNSWGISREEA